MTELELNKLTTEYKLD